MNERWQRNDEWRCWGTQLRRNSSSFIPYTPTFTSRANHLFRLIVMNFIYSPRATPFSLFHVSSSIYISIHQEKEPFLNSNKSSFNFNFLLKRGIRVYYYFRFFINSIEKFLLKISKLKNCKAIYLIMIYFLQQNLSNKLQLSHSNCYRSQYPNPKVIVRQKAHEPLMLKM